MVISIRKGKRMSRIILTAETGSDMSAELSRKYNIYIVPMHVTFGDETLDDGTFPTQKVCDYYDATGKVPKTSGCSPDDFRKVFDRIHDEYPDALILHLAYSASTTCSYQSGCVAAENMPFVTLMDTKAVSVGQTQILVSTAEYLKSAPDAGMDDAVRAVTGFIRVARQSFMPDNLAYIRAGGRVSNAAYLGTRILNIHPSVDVIGGKLLSAKKYRGNMEKVAPEYITNFSRTNRLRKDHVWLQYTPGVTEKVRGLAEQAARDYGFRSVDWLPTGCVITTHGGPGAIGIAGYTEE
jgi:DegV family protein with EDD domain